MANLLFFGNYYPISIAFLVLILTQNIYNALFLVLPNPIDVNRHFYGFYPTP